MSCSIPNGFTTNLETVQNSSQATPRQFNNYQELQMAEIPTLDQIKAAPEFLSAPDSPLKVAKIGANFAVKFGRTLSLHEAENMQFVSSNTNIPVPKVFAAFADVETKVNYIVMEFIPGCTLQQAWPSLNEAEKLDIAKQLETMIKELREVQPPDYLGSVGRRPLADGVFWVPDLDNTISGPFASESALNEGILKHISRTEAKSMVQLVRELISSTLVNHKVKFTHGDIQQKNIMISQVGQDKGGNRRYKITLIDWEISGWYPEYWEFCNAMIGASFKPEWLELLRRILPLYANEYLMMQMVRSLLFY